MGSANETDASSHTRRDVLVIIAFALAMIAPQFFTRGLWSPDEPRYMQVTREMLSTGDYLVPHRNGEYYPDKPPLWFWLAAGLDRAGAGLNAGRALAACASLGTLLLVYFLGRRLLGGSGGLPAALTAGAMPLFLAISKIGIIDPLFVMLITAALLGGWLALQGRRTWWLVVYAVCGLAVLTKGPVGIALPAFILLAYAVLDRKRVAAGGWTHAAGAALFAVIVAGWLVPAGISGGKDYVQDILFGQQARYTLSGAKYSRWPTYYLMLLPVALFPWILFAVLSLAQCVKDWRAALGSQTEGAAARAARQGAGEALFLACWFLGVLVFFSFIPSKRERYLLPLVPAAGLLCARYFILGLKRGFPWPVLHKTFGGVTLALCGLLGFVTAASPWISRYAPSSAPPKDATAQSFARALATPAGVAAAMAVGFALLLVVALACRSLRRSAWRQVVAALLAVSLLISLTFDLLVLPAIDPIKCERAFVERALPYINEADQTYLYDQDYEGIINLYAGATTFPVLKADTRGEREKVLIALLSGGRRVVVIGGSKALDPILAKLPPNAHAPVRQHEGVFNFVLVCNWGEGRQSPIADDK